MLHSLTILLHSILSKMQNLSWQSKAFAFVLTFFAPLYSLLVLISALLLVDMLTSIYYQMREAAKGGVGSVDKLKRSLHIIQSGKLRKTAEKMFFYSVFILVAYPIDTVVLQIKPLTNVDGISAISAFSLTNFAALLICLVEITSIAANVTKITGNPVFERIVKLFSKKAHKQLDIEEDEKN
ncbi:MAG: phage holin family protein [Bacteroidales bacterium]|nr:phage holin family protein [Bacteroidales bacterium]